MLLYLWEAKLGLVWCGKDSLEANYGKRSNWDVWFGSECEGRGFWAGQHLWAGWLVPCLPMTNLWQPIYCPVLPWPAHLLPCPALRPALCTPSTSTASPTPPRETHSRQSRHLMGAWLLIAPLYGGSRYKLVACWMKVSKWLITYFPPRSLLLLSVSRASPGLALYGQATTAGVVCCKVQIYLLLINLTGGTNASAMISTFSLWM